MASTIIYLFFKVFYLKTEANLVFLLALMLTTAMAGFVGFLDDFVIRKNIESIGLKKWQKPILTLIFALPLAAVNGGVSTIILPFFGTIHFGIIYPIIIIPLAIMFTANSFNIMAGFNGLEGSMGIIILSTMGIICYTNNVLWLSLICFIAVGGLLSYLFFNWYPSKIFPGDSFTYSVGALIGAVAVLGNMETVVIILFAPYFLDFVLLIRHQWHGYRKIRGPPVMAFGVPDKDNNLSMPHRYIYDTCHIAMFIIGKFKRVKEPDVVKLIIACEMILAIFCLGVFV
jgi:UDP-N-acetylglucosamine--dolichyl-phosphate N-acetylglucosaminephosphotransferase